MSIDALPFYEMGEAQIAQLKLRAWANTGSICLMRSFGAVTSTAENGCRSFARRKGKYLREDARFKGLALGRE
jgi:hypothetical protein